MDTSNYEQTHLTREILGDAVDYLTSNLPIRVEFFDGKAVGIELPQTVELKVIETEPGIKSATASSVTKPAKTETGLVVQVPPFINEGETIKVDTAEGVYLSGTYNLSSTVYRAGSSDGETFTDNSISTFAGSGNSSNSQTDAGGSAGSTGYGASSGTSTPSRSRRIRWASRAGCATTMMAAWKCLPLGRAINCLGFAHDCSKGRGPRGLIMLRNQKRSRLKV